MWKYNYGPYTDSEYLAHYGVLGMKWGVRKDPSKAYGKAIKKKNTLKKKAVDYEVKSAKTRQKALKKETKATNEKQYEKARKLEFQANKYALKSANLQKKGLNWVKKMDKVFRDYKVERASDGSYLVYRADSDDN